MLFFNLFRKKYLLIISAFAFVTFLVVTTLLIVNVRAVQFDNNYHLIMLYDHGKKTTFETDKKTIGEALDAINIKVSNNDSVEPTRDTELSAKQYYVNIYRARPVLVIDGNERKLVLTSAQTAPLIAKAANITIYNEDKATIARNNDYVSDGAGITMTITRAKELSVVLYGKPIKMRTLAKTVGEFIKEKNINLTKDDRVSVGLSSNVYSDMSVRIWREGVQTVTAEEAIQYGTQQIQDGDQLVGYKAVQTQGVIGKKNVTYTVTIQDGVEVNRQQIASVVIQQPVSEVDVVGAKTISGDISGSKYSYMSAAGISSSDYSYADYIITRESGWCATKWQGEYGSCPSYHGAPSSSTVGYGLCQATPGYKMSSSGDDWATNPLTQLRWCSNYANRYGGWSGAYNHWLNNHNW
jgi:uncharacterized protein YabE (DUF348 family)